MHACKGSIHIYISNFNQFTFKHRTLFTALVDADGKGFLRRVIDRCDWLVRAFGEELARALDDTRARAFASS